MKVEIIRKLKHIEKEYDIKILYACESGSRSWGQHNINSDYDIRFIYIHRPNWYLTIDSQKDFIELPISEKLDITGWELQKCLKSYRKSNPTILECIHSKVVYLKSGLTVNKLRYHTKDIFSPKACLYHYLHMGDKNYRRKNVKNKVKNYFNILRPILSARWIEANSQYPSVEFSVLVEKMVPTVEIKEEIQNLIVKKSNGESTVSNVENINEFINNEIKRLFEYVKTIETNIKDPTPLLNDLFLDSLRESWEIEI
ncbi:nucleotidyltransferase domain-containing protein [Neobacillus sp. YX16]|uniref:nucleotidyltransferase domain-containing protein n=1 Tax=Neobacillus sp. YX16 TaxID=3047874 RepID=UPI0024C31A0C|nr:nucleotidyltransferase domain-containing protein [Neobacillus sp. YX16]WHZ03885.1 nucleotidyltransferase domain-containing protein [Neobacillus sp. YX16]